MADKYTALATAQNSNRVRQRADGNELTANVVWARGRFTTPSAPDPLLVTGDVLKIAQLPKGAVVVPGLCFIDTEDCGTGISIKIGDSDVSPDDARYTTAVTLATAGRVAFTGGLAGPNPHALQSQCWIQGVIVDAGSIAVDPNKDFTVWIAYVLP